MFSMIRNIGCCAMILAGGCTKGEEEPIVVAHPTEGAASSTGASEKTRIARTNDVSTSPKLLGEKLSGLAATPMATILAKTNEMRGTSLMVEGQVKAVNSTGRDWFALIEDNGASGYIRVILKSDLEIPDDINGHWARVEGRLDVLTLPAKMVEYFDKSFGLKSANPGQELVVRAVGVEFVPVGG